MKIIYVFALLAVFSVFGATAQKKGKITYDQVINVHKNLSSDQQALKALIPETMTKKYQFIFVDGQARLKELKQESNVMIVQMGGETSTDAFFNLKDKTVQKFFELDGESFYTEKNIEFTELKPTSETKKILGYTCKAYTTHEMKFWVTKELPSLITPLPPFFIDGAILAIENDQISYTAVKIEKEATIAELEKPKAQKVTAEQAEDLQEEILNNVKQKYGNMKRINKNSSHSHH